MDYKLLLKTPLSNLVIFWLLYTPWNIQLDQQIRRSEILLWNLFLTVYLPMQSYTFDYTITLPCTGFLLSPLSRRLEKSYFPFLFPCTKVFSPHSQSSYEINNLPVSCHKTSNSFRRKGWHPFLHHLQYSPFPFRTKPSEQPKLFERYHQQVQRGKITFLVWLVIPFDI